MRARPAVPVCLGLVALITPIASPLAAEEAELGKYVPAGVHFYLSAMPDDATRRLQEPYGAACRKLMDSGIGEDIIELITMELGDAERDFVRTKIDAALELLRVPDWSAMASREFAMAFRISIPIPEYLFLCRGEKGTAPLRWNELRQVLQGLAGFAPDVLSVTESTLNGAKVARLGAAEFPVGLMVAARDDALLISTSDILLDSSLRLMDAEDASGSIVESARFKASQEGLPPGAARSYFDLGGYIGFVRGLMGMAQGAAGFQPGGAEMAVFSLVSTLLDELSRLETVSASEGARGRQYTSDVRLGLAQRDGPGFIEKLISEQEPVRDFHRVVPKDAINFLITSGIDPETIYDVALAYVKERVPDGEMVAQQWEGMQQSIGFHLKNDLLSWIDGGCGCITLPARGGGGSECVFLMRLKDAEKARRFVKMVFDGAKGYVESRGHKMDLVRVPGNEDHFHELRIDAVPWCHPVIGTPGSLLVLASSADAASRVIDTFKGDAPSIREHPRFKSLSIPDGPLTKVYYYNVQDSLTACANVLGTVGFAASLVPEERDTRPAIKVGAILTKFAAFLRDVDLSVYTAGWSRYDETRHEVNTRIVTEVKAAK